MSILFLFINFLILVSELHTPVLLESVINIALPMRSEPLIIVDATLGLGGHSLAMIQKMARGSQWIGIDRDKENLDRAAQLLIPYLVALGLDYHFIHANFMNIGEVCQKLGLSKIDFALYDLGVSSVHYDEAERGFSYRFDGPLDMRFDRSEGITARDVINTYDVHDLKVIFREYGEEPKAHFIAQAIERARKSKKIETTQELSGIIETSSFDKKSILRVFQALRIAVNQEFVNIQYSLHEVISLLALEGRIAVISFHSLEDRLVKHTFQSYLKPRIDDTTGQIIEPPRLSRVTKKPIEPTPQEISINPRSRSAKLRVVERTF